MYSSTARIILLAVGGYKVKKGEFVMVPCGRSHGNRGFRIGKGEGEIGCLGFLKHAMNVI